MVLEYNNLNRVVLEKRELKWLNDLMKVCFDDYESDENMRKLIDDLDAKQDETIVVGSFEFSNGNTIYVNVSSGSSNYYDNAWLLTADGQTWDFDCGFGIDEDMQFEYNGDLYNCHITIKE